MSSVLASLNLLLMLFAGWLNRDQLDVIAYLQEENRVLKVRLSKRSIRFTDAPSADDSLEKLTHSSVLC
jgi:hypothetical protein